ncbi:hypothetical protein EDB85DRAFT_1890140 [Lactarius pseudohatsudake]|nr:hypothetical protein EDB85DRAFT_1890140 [Lactarius pseudohatsudake]
MDSDNESLTDPFPDGFESDNEVLLQPVTPSAVNELTVGELRELFKTLQLDYQSLAKKYKALKIDRDELAASRRPANAARAPRGSLSGESKEISLAGGRFSVAGELWVDAAMLDVTFPQGFDPLNPARYSANDPHANARGVMAELYLDLAPHLQQLLMDRDRKKSFKSIFLRQLNQERANSVHLTCTYAGKVLQVDSNCFFTRTFDRTNVPALRRLLENPNKPSDLYPLWSPLLFPNQDIHSTRPFQSMPLVRCLRLILFGPSSIDGEGAAKRTTKGVLWGVKKTTPGMIATAATLLVYACSQDQSFSRTMGPSGVSWKARFDLYKQSIIRFPIGYRTELLSWFDKLLFKNSGAASGSSSGAGSLTGDQGHGEVEDLIERVNQATITSSPPAHVAQPVDADNHDPTPSSRAQSPSSDGALGPSPGQMGQPPKDARTTDSDQTEELMEDDHEQNIAARRPKRQSGNKQPQPIDAQKVKPTVKATKKTAKKSK